MLTTRAITDQIAGLLVQRLGIPRLDAELLVRPLEQELRERVLAAASPLDPGFD